MHLSNQAGWYDVKGNAEYIPANKQYADDDPAVKALPHVFDKITDDAAPKAAVRAAKAEAKAKADG